MKWTELQKRFEAFSDDLPHSDDGSLSTEDDFKFWNLRIMMEIYGALDQVALALREQTKLTAAILERWNVLDKRGLEADARSLEAERRNVESHAHSMKLYDLAIAREERAAKRDAEHEALEAEYRKRAEK